MREVFTQDAAKGFFGRAGYGAVIIREVEVRHAEVEGAQRDSPGDGRIIDAPEIMPEPKRDLWEMQARFTAACLEGRVGIAGGAGGVHTVEKTAPLPLSQREKYPPLFSGDLAPA